MLLLWVEVKQERGLSALTGARYLLLAQTGASSTVARNRSLIMLLATAVPAMLKPA